MNLLELLGSGRTVSGSKMVTGTPEAVRRCEKSPARHSGGGTLVMNTLWLRALVPSKP